MNRFGTPEMIRDDGVDSIHFDSMQNAAKIFKEEGTIWAANRLDGGHVLNICVCNHSGEVVGGKQPGQEVKRDSPRISI